MAQDMNSTISLYQKELHHVRENGSPRRWTVPKPTITQSQFRKLIHNRSKALQRLQVINQAKNNKDLEIEESGTNTGTSTIDKEKRMKEIVERLAVLKERKHLLMQRLKQRNSGGPLLPPQVEKTLPPSQLEKPETNSGQMAPPQVEKTGTDSGQILNSEPSNQANSRRPLLHLQAKITGMDLGRRTRINTPKRASDGSLCSQRVVTSSNPSMQPRHVPLITSNSSLSGSQPQWTASTAVTGRPSQFTPSIDGSGQGPWISSPGTSYIAPSPSCAPSEETLPFRVARQLSPWRNARQARQQVEITRTDSGSMTRINTPEMASGGNRCSQRAVNGSNPQQLKPDSNMILNAESSNQGNFGRPPLPRPGKTTEVDSDMVENAKNKEGKRDAGWGHGECVIDGNNRWTQCKYCDKKMSGISVTRLKQHLAGGYSDVKKCEKCPSAVRKEMKELLLSKNEKPV